MSKSLATYQSLKTFIGNDNNIIVSGPPGCGKSFAVRKTYPEGKVIRGGISAAAFIRHLAVLAYDDQPKTVILDDSEDLIKQNLNLFKAILDSDYPYAEWEKTMGPTLRTLQKDPNPKSMFLHGCMMKFFNGVGLTIPTDKMHFIVLTNENITNTALLSRCEYGVCVPDFQWVCDALKLTKTKAAALQKQYSGNDIRKALTFL